MEKYPLVRTNSTKKKKDQGEMLEEDFTNIHTHYV